jgi:hypothetical protein
MATVNKDFKIKYGLIVEGAQGTINNQTILTEVDGDAYILDLIGGETLITSVESTQMEVTSGELNIKSGVFDLDGAAAQALIDANDHTDTALLDYTTTANLDTTVGGYGYLKNADLPTMYSDADVDAHLSGGDGITYSSGAISADLGTGLKITVGQIAIDRAEVDTYYDPAGAAGDVASDLSTHEGLTSGVHGVTGSVVGTTDDQDLSNKRFIDTVYFTDGVTVSDEGEIAVRAVTHDFDVQANIGDLNLKTVASGSDVNISSTYGDILLNPNGAAYYGSASPENEIATHNYVDNAVSGLAWKPAVNLLSTTNFDISGDLVGDVIDGHAAFTTADNGYRILLTGQSTDAENGIYELLADGATLLASRPADANSYDELIGAAVYVMEGAQYGSTSWVQGDHYITTFAGQDWTQFSGQGSVTAGTGIVVDGLEVSVDFTVVAEVQDLTDGLALKQDTLTAGNNIDITGVTISVTGLDAADISDFDAAAVLATAASYDVIGAAAAAQEAAEDYADGLAVNYDAAGAAATAETNANSYTDTEIGLLDTDDIEEGSVNLYFTDTRAKDSAASLLTGATLENITITGTGSGLTITAENGVADSDTDDLDEGSTNLYFTDSRAVDALEAVVPNFTAVEINSLAKQVAATISVATASQVTAYEFLGTEYRSAKFLVKTAQGSHTEVSEVLLTMDSSNNIAITEYAMVGTNGSLMTITADYVEIGTTVRLRVTTANNTSVVTVVGTLLA